MTLVWGAKLTSCFVNWLLLAFFVAQSFTITHSWEINLPATTICIIIVIFVDEIWSSVWKPLITVYKGCRHVRHQQQQQSFYWHYLPGGSVTLYSNGVIIHLRPCALDYFYSKVSSFPCSFFLVLQSYYDLETLWHHHPFKFGNMVSAKSDTRIILYWD